MPDGHAAPPSGQIHSPETQAREVRPDWSAYATAYDLLSDHNPAYRALVADFTAFLGSIERPRVIYDIGGGTGNYTEVAARLCPESEVHLMEPDAGMIGHARAKLAAHDNVRYHNIALEDVAAEGAADLVICVHALYAMPGQGQRLDDLRRLLRPGGLLYLIDLGRDMNVGDWRGYLFSHLKKERGLAGALRVFWQGREIAKQNAAIRKAQKSGLYWTHSGAELASAVSDAGFDILRQDSVYRDYSDLLVCRAVS